MLNLVPLVPPVLSCDQVTCRAVRFMPAKGRCNIDFWRQLCGLKKYAKKALPPSTMKQTYMYKQIIQWTIIYIFVLAPFLIQETFYKSDRVYSGGSTWGQGLEKIHIF